MNTIIKEKFHRKLKQINKPKFFYSFHFSSIFYPGSLKHINLFLRSAINKNDSTPLSKNGTYKNNKILLKQSYLLITWIHYLCKNNNDITGKRPEKQPSFFIHPYSQSKTTLIRSPLAHKTFSQEQFLTRYYYISVSFKPCSVLLSSDVINSVNGSVYSSNFIKNNVPIISTNLLFLKKISYFYNSKDSVYYSYHIFNKNIL